MIRIAIDERLLRRTKIHYSIIMKAAKSIKLRPNQNRLYEKYSGVVEFDGQRMFLVFELRETDDSSNTALVITDARYTQKKR
jgi:hypothetical protein